MPIYGKIWRLDKDFLYCSICKAVNSITYPCDKSSAYICNPKIIRLMTELLYSNVDSPGLAYIGKGDSVSSVSASAPPANLG